MEAGSGGQDAKGGNTREGIYFDEFKQKGGTWNELQNMETEITKKPNGSYNRGSVY